MIILGVNAYHGDASAAIVVDGQLVACVEEERFSRVKHAAGFPYESVKFCLKQAGVDIKQVDFIAVPRDPRARLFTKIYYGLKIPKLAARRLLALHKTQGIKKTVAGMLGVDEKTIRAPLVNIEHHQAHIASSFFVSPFDKAALFSEDGLGDFASTMWGMGQGNRVNIAGSISFPHSLGMYYTAVTQYLGFLSYGDEYKVMGLAALGKPSYHKEFEKILRYDKDLRFSLGLEYFLHHKKMVDMNFEEGYPTLEALYSKGLERLLGRHREKDEPLEQRHKDISASLQERIEEVVFALVNDLYKLYDYKQLCLSGGVAYNCVVNGKLLDKTPFSDIYVPPAAGDAGLAIGAVYYVWNQVLGKPRGFLLDHAYWGPSYDMEAIGKQLTEMSAELSAQGCRIEKVDDDTRLFKATAQAISEGKIVGWFQGRMEWGPRALGNRSIVVDPRRHDMKDTLNKRIKHRETFRPFAPSVLEEKVGEYFDKSHPSPFMLFTYNVLPDKRDVIPAPTHVDGTGRLQTVSKKINPRYWNLIKEFENITGVPVLLNTSFNENEPVVNTPRQALECFLRTKMDMVVLENYMIYK
ncbi:MAG: carbamoyltransferase [Candidatus Omnitrophica bacterium]|nr:carbamoyltransferase [Candidatus Omnitrophota bacterium]